MKTIKRAMFGMLLAAGFTACSSNEDVTAPGSNEEQGLNGKSYMAINLTMTGASRAITDGGYEDGTEAESAVSIGNSIFLFYDANNNYLTSGQIATDEGTDGFLNLTNQSGNIENSSNAVIVLGPTKVKPSKVLAVLNYDQCASLQNKTLAQALEEIDNSPISTAKGKFTMTNSVYMDAANNIVNVSGIKEENIKTSEDDAKANPVSIYVERVVAKIGMTANQAVATTDGKYVFNITDGDDVLDSQKLKFRLGIDGWAGNAYNTNGYLVKKLNANWGTTAKPFDGWNNAADHRCYWAADANYTSNGENKYDFSKEEQTGTYKGLTYKTWNEVQNGGCAQDAYYFENTVAPNAQAGNPDAPTNVTTLLIAASIQTSNDNGTTWKSQDIYQKDGAYYTAEFLQKAFMNEFKGKFRWYDKTNATEYTSDLALEDLTWDATISSDNKSSVTITVKSAQCKTTGHENAVLQKSTNSGWQTAKATDLTAALTNSHFNTGLTGYKGGACYYQVPIEHLGTSGNTKNWGIVRNHIYRLTLSNINRIGNPVYNKDEKLVTIPGKNENYYVSAQLNILAWKVLSQDVVIE